MSPAVVGSWWTRATRGAGRGLRAAGRAARATAPYLPLLCRLAIPLAALAALAVGFGRIYAPLGYIVPGALVWLEVARYRRRGTRPDEPPEGGD